MIYDARVRSFLVDMQVGIVSQTKGAPAILPKVVNALGRTAGRRVPRHFHASSIDAQSAAGDLIWRWIEIAPDRAPSPWDRWPPDAE
jgi:hypothetical protein